MDISYQLYTSRKFPLNDTLKALADAGVSNVEGFDPLYEDASGLAKTLKDFGLSMPSGHMGIDMLEGDFDAAMKNADTLGIELIVAPYLVEELRPKDKKGWVDFGGRMAKIADKVAATGRQFAWHNHDFEFVPLMDNSLPIDAILGASDNIQSELDLAWVYVSKKDPAAELKRLKDRVVTVHIKDIAPMGENMDQDGWTYIGKGIVDWEAISIVLPDTAAKYKILEHDNPKDPIEFIRQSVPFTAKI